MNPKSVKCQQDAGENTKPDFSRRKQYYTMYLDAIGPEISKLHKTDKMLLLKCETIEELYLLEKILFWSINIR
ncbi:hypothetical protein NEPAR06_2482 [Nematocida parisii]|uniref:Uncharacterized protein n=1 Tax=Nematocida parisii (strain ERTm3) TaxID=935791 RepID=I3EGZ3_NEMP3|nr:uncharacterized protein NEPG_00266 [Nematocida parisii ERTm1]EIJ88490.1 hypothetical protein NEQG_01180 [Nematocida parisii ERTm3]KAI5131610.1 hypothetical protein NEPAR03_2495 [Nematocida parisii]EIJ94742.1 hypothetical protein NEPG_00266 [Nematocida parisii ERTm1]KAI5146524.1 hypothetical protein NEPAR07_2443 [Nematocida parisii]KAI5157665.1 hypothetical protein NEPAR06_2482 [Nematocida parisii]|eukprot:XP_013058098.1 hypothetical protein NEPG_00266 [Nematocida parisii ERTm1]